MGFLRSEHPNPQWKRENWRNLNGKWEFEFDFGASARERKLYEKDKLEREITVPFCPESKLSGIGYKDFMNAVCYRRTFVISESETEERIFLHFGAVDFKAYVYINKTFVGSHIGGYSSFSFDITDYLHDGENSLFVIAEDDIKSRTQPRGKQSDRFYSHDCDYTRTTGIWQTVWLEFVPTNHIIKAKYFTDIENGILTIQGETRGRGEIKAEAEFEGEFMGSASIKTAGGNFILQLKLKETKLWEVGKGGLYNLYLSFGKDRVKSYFGMRSLRLDGMKFLINEKPVFQRLVLDQGFYPDGVYTAESEEDLVRDIELSLAAGFNGARLHQKVFEPEFLYHCDRLGYIVWGEHANWGIDYKNAVAVENFTNEWIEIVERDFNHPSIVGWCPFNETWEYEEINLPDRVLELNYRITKQLDPTRPCIDTSGNYHAMTDIYDTHNYEEDVEKFTQMVRTQEITGKIYDSFAGRQNYNGEPTFISEYGGIRWILGSEEGWGYGNAPKTEDEFIERYKGLTDALLDAPDMFGFCYTQLYDVEQEKNGLYTYERKPKFDMEIFKKINSRKAASEK